MSWSWSAPPPLVSISGSEAFLWNRELQVACREAAKAGRRIVRVEDSHPTPEVEDALSCALTFGESLLVVVRHGAKLDPGVVEDHVASGVESTLLLLHEGDLKKKAPSLSHPKLVHLPFERPGSRKDRKALAIRFASYEAQRLLPGSTLGTKLATGLVGAVGTDLGMVSQEVLKASALAKARGDSEISVEHLRGTVRKSAEMDLQPLAKALGAAQATQTVKALYQIKGSISGDPLMLLLRARGGPGHLAMEWLAASYLLENTKDPQEIAERLGTPRWAVERDVIPAARRWGTANLRLLVHGLARVEAAVLRGSPAPWVALVSVLAEGCHRAQSR